MCCSIAGQKHELHADHELSHFLLRVSTVMSDGNRQGTGVTVEPQAVARSQTG